MKLKVPFDIDSNYIEFLNKTKEVTNIYFSFPQSVLPSARNHQAGIITQDMFKDKLLTVDKRIKKHLVLNGIFSDPKLYTCEESLKSISKNLEKLYIDGVIDSLIVYDMYLINTLATYNKDFFKVIDIIPTINFKIDSVDRIMQISNWFSEILEYDYKPSIITIDRALNRDQDTIEKIKKYAPDAFISTIVNEGCLANCVFKNTHDSLISLMNIDSSINITDAKIDEINCHSLFNKNHSNLLKIPFIRPEDTALYKDVDIFKISGRFLSASVKQGIIQSYINKSFNFNMLDLLEVTNSRYEGLVIDNEMLEHNSFGKITSNCKFRCSTCTYCKDLAQKLFK